MFQPTWIYVALVKVDQPLKSLTNLLHSTCSKFIGSLNHGWIVVDPAQKIYQFHFSADRPIDSATIKKLNMIVSEAGEIIGSYSNCQSGTEKDCGRPRFQTVIFVDSGVTIIGRNDTLDKFEGSCSKIVLDHNFQATYCLSQENGILSIVITSDQQEPNIAVRNLIEKEIRSTHPMKHISTYFNWKV